MRTLIALSGGVDSSVAALLLAREGHELVGVTLKNWCYGAGDGEGRSCCSLESIEAARRVAAQLGFPHYVVNAEVRFAEHVTRPFLREYLEGRTPNPCVACNAKVRFPGLAERARAFGCSAIATGHYARTDGPGGRIRRALDREKDQSYVLWAVPGEVRSRLVLPLGSWRKREVRALAAEAGLEAAERPDSQEICFVPDGDYGAFLERSSGGAEGGMPAGLRPGEVVRSDGTVVGTHGGVARYTVGQRRGLGVALGIPVYVTGLDARANRVVVGPEQDLLSSAARLREVLWPAGAAEEVRVAVQIRSRHRAAAATVRRTDPGGALVRFDEPQRAVTPGQSAVFYDGDAVAGGGVVVESTAPARQG